jgi:hypothetical protein
MNEEYFIGCEEVELSALEGLAIMWDVRIRAMPTYDTYNLQLIDPADDRTVAQFSGPLKKVLRDADAWLDGVEFTFAPAEAAGREL